MSISIKYRTLKQAIDKRHSNGKLATIAQIKKLSFDLGQLDEAYKYIRNYGIIISDKEWFQENDSPTGYYKAGFYRDMEIEYCGVIFSISMYNGDVNRFGVKE